MLPRTDACNESQEQKPTKPRGLNRPCVVYTPHAVFVPIIGVRWKIGCSPPKPIFNTTSCADLMIARKYTYRPEPNVLRPYFIDVTFIVVTAPKA